MLAYRRATGFPTDDDATVTIDQFFQKIDVFVVDIHRAGTFAIYENRVFSYSFRTVVFSSLRLAARSTGGFACHTGSTGEKGTIVDSPELYQSFVTPQ